MLHRHILQCIILIFAPPVLLLSQTTAPTLKNVTLPSPNAASLGKYGEIPVGNYTGIPQVSVPLHTITAGDLQLPVSISYHAAGIKLEEIPSSVGTGWTLNIGGAITRSIRGNADKYTGSNHYQTMATMGALYGFSRCFF
jgi:hypothetical protein